MESPETIATAIRIGNPASWYSATAAASESGGSITAVTDEEILDAYTFLAQQESVFCEAASAASVAGLIKTGVPEGSKVVCVLTGHGLKDPDLAIGQIQCRRSSTSISVPSWPSFPSDWGWSPWGPCLKWEGVGIGAAVPLMLYIPTALRSAPAGTKGSRVLHAEVIGEGSLTNPFSSQIHHRAADVPRR